ncbi:MAG: ORF6N domain-containing protein [Bacteroidia bacterium]
MKFVISPLANHWFPSFSFQYQSLSIMETENLIMPESILKSIYLIRNQKVMLDHELAQLYGVETKRLNEQVKRNISRFPDDFMFQLSAEEWHHLRSQFATSSDAADNSWGGRRVPPYVFTELGVAMLSSVLNSQVAIQVNISIMRVFVNMRKWAANYEELLSKVDQLNEGQCVHSEHIRSIYNLIEELLTPAIKDRKPIGFSVSR